VDVNHLDLQGNINTELAYNTVNNSKDVTDTLYTPSKTGQGHGTHVMGIIGAVTNNGIGVAGVAANRAEIVPYKIFYVNSAGQLVSDTIEIIEAYNRAIAAGCKIVNMSLGGYLDEGQTPDATDTVLQAIIENAFNRGVLTVVAAGNGNTSKTSFPSDYDSVISVVATRDNNTRWTSSDHNQYKDIAAPGAMIRSTYTGSAYSDSSGTSMASPHVVGVIALMLSAYPDLSSAEVRQILYDTATDLGTPGRDDYFGHGLINAEEAVLAALARQESQPMSVLAELNGDQTAITLDANHVNQLGSIRQVQFAVWGNADGQNDLKWYTGTNLGGGSYHAKATVANHKETGIYNIHAYATLTNGSSVFVGAFTVTVSAPTGVATVEQVNVGQGTFRVRLTNINAPSGVSEVQVPVWSASDQNDIYWYQAVRQNDGSYIADVSIAKHKYHHGTYFAHCYVRSGNGVFAVAAGTQIGGM
jgi:hypothetical protein